MPIDVKGISSSLRTFVRSHNAEFQKLSARQSQLLEIGAFLTAAKHYEIAGYEVELVNPRRRSVRVKLGTRGDPWNFSYFKLSSDGHAFEIHTNLPVCDAVGTLGARYVVDIAIAIAGAVPLEAPPKKGPGFDALDNKNLVTFIEAKALVIYPMLIAQFIGIVHELLPGFLLDKIPEDFEERRHFDPALVSLGYLHGTCWNIVKGLESRGIHIGIVSQFDKQLARLGTFGDSSPLARRSFEREESGDEEAILF